MQDSTSNLIVQAEGLGKQVPSPEGTLTLLEDIHLQIRRGETVAIIGASGSGKTTLLSLLAGLDTPSHGRVRLDGTDITPLSEDDRAAVRAGKVGFVFQSFQLLSGLTALENVMLPLELAGHHHAAQEAQQLLDEVGLGRRVKHYPHQLSGGEQQRVAIARAFVTRPDILFADEPTGNLDQHTGEDIIRLLFTLNREQGTTLVLVTHDAQLAAHCGTHYRLDQGRLCPP